MPGTGLSEAGLVKKVDAILQQLQKDHTGDGGATTDASALAARRKLGRIAESIRAPERSRKGQTSESILPMLTALTRLCDQKFVTFSYTEIPVIWRAIYVDAQLLKACYALQDSLKSTTEQAACVRTCIRDLDLALIVAGAASISKDRHCHDLISALQCKLLQLERIDSLQPVQCSVDRSPPQKRPKRAHSKPSRPVFGTSAQADSDILEYTFDRAPSFVDLSDSNSAFRSTPFIVRGYAQHAGWAAVRSSNDDSNYASWSSFDHLLSVAGPARVVPVEVGADYSREDWGQDVMLWSDFLRQCRWDQSDMPSESSAERGHGSSASRHPILYMAQHDLASQFPALEQDYALPDYVYTSPPPPQDWPDYKPPATSDGVLTNLWIGPAGTISPPHYDPYYNCFVQAVGYKEVWVAPPHCCPRSVTSLGDGTEVEDDTDAGSFPQLSPTARPDARTTITETLMANTASLDVFDPIELIPDHVRAGAAKAILAPGDLLYMPPGWWHSLRSLTRSFSVSMWF